MATQSEIVMYARARSCPDVTRARQRLEDHGIEWTEFDIESNDEKKAEMVALSGRPNVPQVVIGGRILIEPSVEEIDDALTAAGYELDEGA